MVYTDSIAPSGETGMSDYVLDIDYEGENYKRWLAEDAPSNTDGDENRDAYEHYQMEQLNQLLTDDGYKAFCAGRGLKPNRFLSVVEYNSSRQN